MILDVLQLVPHPDTPAKAVPSITCTLSWRDAGHWVAGFIVGAPPEVLALPAPAAPARTDGLWQRTCFELFLRNPENGTYLEFNFSPSGEWAAYRFEGYRAGTRALDLANPWITSSEAFAHYALNAHLEDPALGVAKAWQLGISAVIEEADGTKSYWALAHPQGKPDFHAEACFALELPVSS